MDSAGEIISRYVDNIAGVIICKQCKKHITVEQAEESMDKNDGWLYCPQCRICIITNYNE